MFREKLHNSLDSVSPSPELLDRVSEMMAEEARKPKPKIFISAVKYGGMAAAVCLIVTGAVLIGGRDNIPPVSENSPVVTLSSVNTGVSEEIFIPTTENMREESDAVNGSFDGLTDDTEQKEHIVTYENSIPRTRGIKGYRQRPRPTI